MSDPVAEGLFDADGLIGGECADCRRRHFPLTPTRTCPWCGGTTIAAVRLSTTGTLWAWTAVNAAPPGYDAEVPYGFGVVELVDDGLRIVTRLSDSDPDHLDDGMPMRFVVAELSTGRSVWCFEPEPTR